MRRRGWRIISASDHSLPVDVAFDRQAARNGAPYVHVGPARSFEVRVEHEVGHCARAREACQSVSASDATHSIESRRPSYRECSSAGSCTERAL